MKDKKKKPTQQVVEKPPLNKMRTVVTSDGKEYKILDSLLMKYSNTCKIMLEDQKNDEEIKLLGVHSIYFDFCLQFFNHHKEKQPMKIQLPIKTNQELRYIMEEQDAELIERLMYNEEKFKHVLDAANYLQMTEFEKRLTAGLAIKMTKLTVDELKEMYDLNKEEEDLDEEAIRAEIRDMLETVNENKEETF